MKALHMTKEQAEAHQRKHGFLQDFMRRGIKAQKAVDGVIQDYATRRMNKTEREFSFILEAMKRRGEILRYEFEGITLRWADMKYTPDFVVFSNVMQMLKQMEVIKPGEYTTVEWSGLKLIEVKGAHIWDRDIVRFKGARAYWPEFAFEMHQKKEGQWKRIF
jgi:hypothetical protein